MAQDEISGAKREDNYRVGDKHPPIEYQFTSTNQPANRGRKPGCLNYKTRFKMLLEKYASMPIPPNIRASSKFLSVVEQLIGDNTEQITIEQAEAARVHIAALEGESWAYDRIHDKPQQAVDVTTQGESINPKDVFKFEIVLPEDMQNERKEQ